MGDMGDKAEHRFQTFNLQQWSNKTQLMQRISYTKETVTSFRLHCPCTLMARVCDVCFTENDRRKRCHYSTWIHVQIRLARASLVNTFPLGTKEKHLNENERNSLFKSSLQ